MYPGLRKHVDQLNMQLRVLICPPINMEEGWPKDTSWEHNLIPGRVVVRVDGRSVHLPRIGVALFANLEPATDLVGNARSGNVSEWKYGSV